MGGQLRFGANSQKKNRFWQVWSKGLHSKIGRQFAFLTIACSTVLALLMTFIQFGADFRAEKSDYDSALAKIQVSILPSLTESLWVLDDALIKSQLLGISQIEGISRVEILGADTEFVVSNADAPQGVPIEFPIQRVADGTTSDLGRLVVHASDEHIYQSILRRGLIVLATNFLKTICVSLVILYIFQRLVGQNISRMAEFARAYDPKESGQRIKLERAGIFAGQGELSEFAWLEHSINRWSAITEAHVQQLQNANREQAEFTYAISHDLKSPINTISMLIDELEETVEVDEDAQAVLDDMRTTSGRMGALVVDILDYSRLVEADIVFEEVDLIATIAEIEQDLAADLLAADAKIFTQELPSIQAHPAQMRILFQNLISNAIKFRAPGRAPVIHISSAVSPSSLKITVSDNGIGIPEEHREGVFGLFKRLHTRSVYEGSGLGLTICRRIMSNHDGSISVHSGTDGGTAIQLIFPNQPDVGG